MQSHFARSRAIGPGAGVIKYDVLTALSLLALRDGQTQQTTVMRLIAMITARYNWKLDQLSVPQPDMARLWGVSDRTVKREVRRMVDGGMIRCLRPGVRGRVAAYRLDYQGIAAQSRGCWPDVGPDFEDRMQEFGGPRDTRVVKVDFSRKATPDAPDLPVATDTWGRVLQDLAGSDPASLRNWYGKLTWVAERDGRVILAAPSGFVAQFVQTHLSRALSAALAREIGRQVQVDITC